MGCAGIIQFVVDNGGELGQGEFNKTPELRHPHMEDDSMAGYMIGRGENAVRVPYHFNDFLYDHFAVIRVLDDGFVMLVDMMGNQDSIVQAARVSYGAGTMSHRSDEKLIRYLYSHKHTTPFEMVEYKFLVRVPMDCWRQWIRHRTASVNEYSTRYSQAIDSMQSACSKWRFQGTGNKQGSSGLITDDATIRILDEAEKMLQQMCREVYLQRLELGVAREQARKDLPLSTYTEAYWKIDLHNLGHFLKLRLDSHAQSEIQSYAQAIVRLLEPHVPLVMELINANVSGK